MDNLYSYSRRNPYHVSVGAVLFNNRGEVCVHRYLSTDFPNDVKHLSGGLDEVYILMRETLHDGESMSEAVLRGIEEEFGAKGVVEKYLGALISNVDDGDDLIFEKTTLYHSVRLQRVGLKRDETEIENRSKLLWLAPSDLLSIMEKQVSLTTREELNETEIIRRFIATVS